MSYGISTFREIDIPQKLTPLNLFIFLLTDEIRGLAWAITVRVGTRDAAIAKVEASGVFSDATTHWDGWKDRYQDFEENAVLVEYIDAEYFEHFRDSSAIDREFPPTPKDWLEANEKDRAEMESVRRRKGVNNLKKNAANTIDHVMGVKNDE